MASVASSIARNADSWISGVLFAYALLLLSKLALVGAPVLVDDGFYYLQIARNLASGLGSTFDGINQTNGYHPLWVLALVPVYWVFPENPERALHVSLLIQVLLNSATTVFVFRMARLALGYIAAATVALLWVLISARLSVAGMELSLSALTIVVASWCYVRWFRISLSPPVYRHYLWMGLLVSISFLARLDNVFLVLIIGSTLGIDELRRGLTERGRVQLLLFALPVLILCGGYLALNVWYFGGIMPVSGAVKAAWSRQLLLLDPLYAAQSFWTFLAAKSINFFWPLRRLSYPLAWFVLLGCFGSLILWLVSRIQKVEASAPQLSIRLFLRIWGFLFAAGILQYSYYAFAFHGGATYGCEWYYVIQPISGALIVGLFAEWSLRWIRMQTRVGSVQWLQSHVNGLATTLAILLLSLIVGLGIKQVVVESRSIRNQGLVQGAGIAWIRENTEPGAIIGSWNAGALGYLSGRQVVNLDGLVNSREFYLAQREDLCRYWDRIGVDYIADVMDLENGPAAVVPLKYTFEGCIDRLVLIASMANPGQPWRFQVFRFVKLSR